MFGIGLQIFALLSIGLTILLMAYAVYVRIRSSTYTERKFSFVALWSCATVISAAFLSVSNVQLLSIAADLLGIKLEVTTLPEKALIAFLAVAYCYIVRGWSLGWHGLLTEQGQRNKNRQKNQGFIASGLEETLRIIKRRPAIEPVSNVQKKIAQLALGTPIDELPQHEQIRLLAEVKWPEYESFETWVGEASCWLGRDRAYGRAILLVCAENVRQIHVEALIALAKRKAEATRPRMIIALRSMEQNGDELIRSLREECDLEMFSLDQLVDSVANFEEYKRCIKAEFKEKCLPDASFAIADIVAPTRVRIGLAPQKLELEDIEEDEDIEKEPNSPIDFSSLIAEWLNERSSTRQIALLGKYGQGKSTAALALTYALLFDSDFSRSCNCRVPVLIRLTGKSPSTTRLAELLGAWGAQYNLSGQVLLALHRAGRLLLIFDAFDEMAHVMDRTARFEHFDALWEFASGGAKLLFTGRPNFFLDDEELKEILGISKNAAIGPYCEAVRVAPFDIEQIERAVSWLKDDKRLALVEAVKESHALRKVCCRPSLLYLIAHLWNRDRLDLQNASVNSAVIVREFIAYSLERQVQKQKDDAARRSERQFLTLTKNELDYFTSGIAVASLTEGRQNSISKDVFEARIVELFERIPSMKPGKDGVRSLALPIKARFADITSPTEACIHAVRTHGVIEHDVSRSRHYRFSHKSFCEVLAAEVLMNSILLDDDVSAAIELANSISLVELADQPQIVEFVADFLAGSGSKVSSLSYVELYKKVFPSYFEQGAFVRLRSFCSAVVFLSRHVELYRRISFLVVPAMATAIGVTAALYLFWYGRTDVDLLEQLSSFRSFPYGSYVFFLFTAVVVLSVCMDVLGRPLANVTKFNLIWRLCSLLEKNGIAMYPTRIERNAHRRASEVLSLWRAGDFFDQYQRLRRLAVGSFAQEPRET